MVDILIVGFPIVVVVTTLVEVLKRLLKIEGDAAILLSIIIGEALVVGNHFAQAYPIFGEYWELGIMGLLIGLGACGFFDLGQAVKPALLAARAAIFGSR